MCGVRVCVCECVCVCVRCEGVCVCPTSVQVAAANPLSYIGCFKHNKVKVHRVLRQNFNPGRL